MKVSAGGLEPSTKWRPNKERFGLKERCFDCAFPVQGTILCALVSRTKWAPSPLDTVLRLSQRALRSYCTRFGGYFCPCAAQTINIFSDSIAIFEDLQFLINFITYFLARI